MQLSIYAIYKTDVMPLECAASERKWKRVEAWNNAQWIIHVQEWNEMKWNRTIVFFFFIHVANSWEQSLFNTIYLCIVNSKRLIHFSVSLHSILVRQTHTHINRHMHMCRCVTTNGNIRKANSHKNYERHWAVGTAAAAATRSKLGQASQFRSARCTKSI